MLVQRAEPALRLSGAALRQGYAMDEINLSIALRQATLTDSDFAYQVKKTALGEYVKKTYGEWDEAFQRRFHDRQWEPAGTQIVVVNGIAVGWIWCTHHIDHISIDGI